MTQASNTFYQDLPAMQHLRQITDSRHYQAVPDNWFIALTDVVNSTIAIENGRYKAVNTVAAVTITAVLNTMGNVDVPYLFGGDGAVVAVPPQAADAVRDALAAIKWLGQESFELEVRAGLLPVWAITEGGHEILAGKLAINENYQQPVFMGGGIEHADRLLKAPHTRPLYEIMADEHANIDLSGYECRWSKHPAANEEVLSLLVHAKHIDTYTTVIDTIQQIYGDAQSRHPIDLRRMRVAGDVSQYHNELGWKQPDATWFSRLLLLILAQLGMLLFRYKDRSWDRYRALVHRTTDHEKFDDTLRMTISGTAAQRAQLTAFLDGLQQRGQVAYGVHTASHSLMTCIVFDRFGRQIHFVDADGGGYAMAARGMKAQLKAQAARSSRTVS